MAFMHAYGRCHYCREEGALWRHTISARRFWLFGPKVPLTVYICDECDSISAHLKRAAGGQDE